MSGPIASRDGERGMILVIVLWLVAMMALLVVALSAFARNNLSLSGIAADRLRNELVLESGIDVAAGMILAAQPQQRNLLAGTPVKIDLGGGVIVEIAIADAAGRIDINRADPDLLKGMAQAAQVDPKSAEALVDAILKWRETVNPPDQQKQTQGQQPPAGQSTGQGQGDAGQPDQSGQPAGQQPEQPATPGAFFSLAQLYSIPGIASTDIDKILPLIGLYSKDGKVNPMAAPDSVLQSIPGITDQQVALISGARAAARSNDPGVAQVLQQLPKFLATNEAKSFIVSVKGVAGPTVIPGSELDAVIVLDANGSSPYRVMSWSW